MTLTEVFISLNLYLDGEKAMAPTPVLLPGKSHGRRSLGGCSPWGREESDMTERIQFTSEEEEKKKWYEKFLEEIIV